MAKKKINNACLVTSITVNNVELYVYQHENGGMFAIDASYLDQVCDDYTNPIIPDIFSANDLDDEVQFVMLQD